MTDTDAAPAFVLPAALAAAPSSFAVCDAAGARGMTRAAAARMFEQDGVLVAHAAWTARRLNLPPPPRSLRIFDALELYAFVRPAAFCAPTISGLCLALGLPAPDSLAAQAEALAQIGQTLLDEAGAWPAAEIRSIDGLLATLHRASWPWAAPLRQALRLPGDPAQAGGGLNVWTRLEPWEDGPAPGEPGSAEIEPNAARVRLAELLDAAGLDEARPSQSDFAALAAHAFAPRAAPGSPRMVLAEAGTGVGKTLGYLAPASLSARINGGPIWLSTYTRALQRQIDRAAAAVYPDPQVRARKAVVRKGRENYLCLLNLEDYIQAARGGGLDLVGAGLVARWVQKTRDGDMTGGEFPSWLPGLYGVASSQQASQPQLADRRGECVHAACPHYRVCFIEKAVRASRTADLVIANHALVLVQAAFDGVRRLRGRPEDAETGVFKRLVFDEGHHLFDAADSAFSSQLSGQEAAELRRWIRGPEGRGRRGRGLDARLAEMVADNETARNALSDAVYAAAALPGDGWSMRIAPVDIETPPAPHGPIEAFLSAALIQAKARGDAKAGYDLAVECAVRPPSDAVAAAAPAAARALHALEAPLMALSRALEDLLDDEAAKLETAERARIEGALRGLDRRARMTLPAWRAMLASLGDPDAEDPEFVDAFVIDSRFGRMVDVAFRRSFVDPSLPLEQTVLRPAHGVLIASATLTDPALEDPFALARARTGVVRLPDPADEARFASPFDYAGHTRVIVVSDLKRDDPRQTAAAMRELFKASGGGAIGLFTAVRRLRAVYDQLAGPLAEAGLPLYAQHVDPLDAGALVDVFRAEEHSCLLGTDAVRDGVDVPGRSLRLIAFDRAPWPRPDLLHKARRERFGGRAYDDALARARIAQAFGRLIRRADDRGVFVMLDAATPSRLFASLPPGVTVERMGLTDALDVVRAFLKVAAGEPQIHDRDIED